MKKIILTIFVILFMSLSSNATTIVSYGAGGVPMTATSGARRVSVVGDHYGFGRNAMFHPDNVAKASKQRALRNCRTCPYNNRYRKLTGNNYNYYPAPMTPAPMIVPQVSRLNKSYTIAPKSSYTRNGITYYN